ncbi:MAG TPA: hypothetical protein VIK85_00680 [Coriobacteriia bacterium]
MDRQGSQGGFATNGQTMEPMRVGQATFVEYADGHLDIVSWSGGAAVTPDIAFARQNLPLLVDGGQPAANLADDSALERRSGTPSGSGARDSGSTPRAT